ncbi:hypothetical protein ACFLR1_06260, partial [Bacteroidota bacterium]
MKSQLLIIGIVLFSSIKVIAQPEDHPHHEKHYADVAPLETDEVKLEVIRPHSQINFSQFGAKIYNKTEDYILVKKHAITFSSDEMGYGTKTPKEDIDFIEPHGDITRTIKVQGGIDFKVDRLNVSLEAFSRASTDGEKVVVDGAFKMKPEKNS